MSGSRTNTAKSTGSKARAAADAPLPAGVHRLESVVPFELPPANVTYFEGAEPCIVDSGIKTDDGWLDLERSAKAAGVSLDRVERIILSHAHLDHAGNAKRIAQQTGAEVLIHDGDAATMRTWGTDDQRNRAYDVGLARAGVPDEIRLRMVERGRAVDAWMDALPDLRPLAHGDRVQAGDRTLETIHTPGHTPGSALFRDAEGAVTVTGDTILEWITPNALQVRRDEDGALATYLETLRGLLQRTQRDGEETWGTLVPGHGRAFQGMGATIERCLRLYEERRVRLGAFLAASEGGMTAWDLVRHEWPDLAAGQTFLATSEVLGHLAIFVAEGTAARQEPEDRADAGHAAIFSWTGLKPAATPERS